ncbi:MAG: tRNA (adenosine(37)-N6)-dimethylallyltransferase MiaA [Alphaproteobacteria bacterium]|nr:tRNA (adenosine(37)-N6)-dimethylallyltransferase MiaA [Alphaproteobacteria bacterium]
MLLAGRRAVLIAGPTAGGKSAAALRLARGLDGVIVNADSMQVYEELRILTARPTAEEESIVPHRLYGHVSAAQAYSVARWLDDVKAVLEEIGALGKRAIFVGGTGLYFKALTAGLSPLPEIDGDVRAYWRAEGINRPPQELFAELMRRDPRTAAGLRPTDPQRIVRALEVIDSTGRPLAEFQEDPGAPLLAPGSWKGIVVLPDRATLHARANARFDRMMETGAVDEVARLKEMQLDSVLPAMRALGVGPLLEMLEGRLSREAAVERSKALTRQYIKRQSTWLRQHMISWRHI